MRHAFGKHQEHRGEPQRDMQQGMQRTVERRAARIVLRGWGLGSLSERFVTVSQQTLKGPTAFTSGD
jgi:hypothetical protein